MRTISQSVEFSPAVQKCCGGDILRSVPKRQQVQYRSPGAGEARLGKEPRDAGARHPTARCAYVFILKLHNLFFRSVAESRWLPMQPHATAEFWVWRMTQQSTCSAMSGLVSGRTERREPPAHLLGAAARRGPRSCPTRGPGLRRCPRDGQGASTLASLLYFHENSKRTPSAS